MTQYLENPQAAAHTASYTYTLTDYQALRRAKRKLNPVDDVLWRWRYAWVVAFSLTVFILIGLATLGAAGTFSRDSFSQVAPALLGLIVLTVLVDVVFDHVLAPWIYKRTAIADKSLAIAFDDETIFWSSEGMRSEIPWYKVTRLVMLEGYLFLFISKLEALCIPQRAFASKDAFDHLVAYAKERVNAQAL